MEIHKEPTAKAPLRAFLVGLSPVRGFLDRVIFSDEVQVTLPRGVGGPHGKLDLLIGSKTKAAENCFVTVAYAISIADPVLGESKKEGSALAKSRKKELEIQTVVQPVPR
ncbi:hypothetical protein GBAR_LOCUS27452 [Geodia barretti]|uniref:Uncharacterized protein n=1 Tax=Geodia barretti TaxID=519541 RepID=A0AA35TMR7_GEOBA|nr:hypothetical protein GBAR_LOCUS27452 [Geodia barretti]